MFRKPNLSILGTIILNSFGFLGAACAERQRFLHRAALPDYWRKGDISPVIHSLNKTLREHRLSPLGAVRHGGL